MGTSLRGTVLRLVLTTLAGVGCASQVPPAGGPPDTVPPEIIFTVPAEGELHVRQGEVLLRFSEYVDRRSFRESVFLSPSAGALTFEWSGTEVRIIPSDTLREATTFILTVGSDLSDTRNNTMTGSFTLAFSTGGVIDSCAISGRVYDESPGGVMIYAYEVPDAGPDTLNPAKARPGYLTQTGADGSYRLSNMKYGRYRVLAVRDVFKNLRYDIQTDMYGMPSGDVRLSPSAREFTGLTFRLTVEDTLRPYITTAKAVDGERVIVRFNEKPDGRHLSEGISIIDTLLGSALRVLDFSPADTGGREFQLVTVPRDSAAAYRLTLRNLSDPAGNDADSAGRSVVFTGGGGSDTLAPRVTFNIKKDSATGVSPHLKLRMSFSRAVDTTAVGGGFSLTTGGSSRVPGTLTWEGSMLAQFNPESPAAPGTWYQAGIVADSLRDVGGSRVADSAVSVRYRITEERFLGSIEGRVSTMAWGDTNLGGASTLVAARNLSVSDRGEIVVEADGEGAFIVDHIPEGLYLISAYRDANGNRRFDYGSPYPAGFAEKYFVYPDTLKIRPGWPVGGVLLGPVK